MKMFTVTKRIINDSSKFDHIILGYNSALYTTIVYIDNIQLGIRAKYIEVLISKKLKVA